MTRKAELAHMDFLQVADGSPGGIYCGSDQEWYAAEGQRLTGCGPSAAVLPIFMNQQTQAEQRCRRSCMMKITDEASKMIRDTLKNNDCSGIRLSLQRSCCGTSLSFDLIQVENEEPVVINEVSVVMDAETEQWTKDVTIELANGALSLRQEGGCGCGCGC